MKILSLLAAAGFLLVATAAFAAGLSDSDYGYLKDHWGLKRDGDVAKNLTATEQAKLHDLINDPLNKDKPNAIEIQVGDYLFQIETCYDRVATHPGNQPCPNAQNSSPGKLVADRNCHSCHLIGTAEAPSFFQIARKGTWTEADLREALISGHRMSPLTLSDRELHDLAAYIASLK